VYPPSGNNTVSVVNLFCIKYSLSENGKTVSIVLDSMCSLGGGHLEYTVRNKL